ncbi:hypothetical protein BT67DRAFT_281742 [Trichocladium antarcticum]|uniref:Uncharacterized protein n=1 Tax=Trichocladium antarcticum TaxID=1450529 RepID=A0AAN6UN57_9PEZI|nr:hypothetical protein BT67DRAFT_281742 [Trichocladium antarcticum]
MPEYPPCKAFSVDFFLVLFTRSLVAVWSSDWPLRRLRTSRTGHDQLRLGGFPIRFKRRIYFGGMQHSRGRTEWALLRPPPAGRSVTRKTGQARPALEGCYGVSDAGGRGVCFCLRVSGPMAGDNPGQAPCLGTLNPQRLMGKTT